MIFFAYLIAFNLQFVFSAIKQVRKNPDDAKTSFLRFLSGTAIVFITFAISWLNIPRRIAFYYSKPSFEPFVNSDLVPGRETKIGRKLGIWYVDRYAVDSRGGTYFRIGSDMDGIGPDVVSYGLAFNPNKQGSPFGNASYRYSHLTGDWYYFSASDDW